MKLTKPPEVECKSEARKACEAPANLTGGPLGKTEVDDIQDRAAWLVCIMRHNAALDCFDKLEEAGYVK